MKTLKRFWANLTAEDWRSVAQSQWLKGEKRIEEFTGDELIALRRYSNTHRPDFDFWCAIQKEMKKRREPQA